MDLAHALSAHAPSQGHSGGRAQARRAGTADRQPGARSTATPPAGRISRSSGCGARALHLLGRAGRPLACLHQAEGEGAGKAGGGRGRIWLSHPLRGAGAGAGGGGVRGAFWDGGILFDKLMSNI